MTIRALKREWGDNADQLSVISKGRARVVQEKIVWTTGWINNVQTQARWGLPYAYRLVMV